jgi:serine/threonine protein kinase
MDEFKDKAPSFNERPRIDKEELKEKERHVNALKIFEKEVRILYDLLNKVLKYNLKERISITEIEKHQWFVKDCLHERNDID